MSLTVPAPALSHRVKVWLGLAAMLLPLAAAQAGPSHGSQVTVDASLVGGSLRAGGAGVRESALELSSQRGNRAAARADISDGALHAIAISGVQSEDCRLGVPRTCFLSHASAEAWLWDVVTFHAANLRDPSQVRWRFAIDGFEDLGPWGGFDGSFATAKFGFYVSTSPFSQALRMNEIDGDFFVAGAFDMPTGPDVSLTLYIQAKLSVEVSNGAVADYSHTARFGWEVPAGVTYTSHSGEFMADHPLPAPVPEPTPLSLLSLGLAALRMVTRRSRAG